MSMLEVKRMNKVQEKENLQAQIGKVQSDIQTIQTLLEEDKKAIQECEKRIAELSTDKQAQSLGKKEGTLNVYLCFKYV